MDDIAKLERELVAAVEAAADLDALEAERISALGKKGRVTELLKGLGAMAEDQRKVMGPALNGLKRRLAEAIAGRRAALEDSALEASLGGEKVDITLPARPEARGLIHPISQVLSEVIAIFADMGFSVAEGPDIETEYYNFNALNIPPDHPARQMQDTFYLPQGADGEARLLRTHTSPVQIRHMQTDKPPYRILVPGRTYRCDSDMTHTPMFHQFEGLVVDESTHMGHLKGCLIEFCRAYFEIDDVPVRFRPSYFPFTEPSAEVDIGCSRKGGELKIGGPDSGGGDDWLEILGCGMVHPRVLEMCGVDSTRYQGFAFGMGTERIAMLKYGIPDLRTFFEADIRWLRHYGFVPLDIPSLTGGLGA